MKKKGPEAGNEGLKDSIVQWIPKPNQTKSLTVKRENAHCVYSYSSEIFFVEVELNLPRIQT